MIFYGTGRVNFPKAFTGDSKTARKTDADLDNGDRHAREFSAGIQE
jgi:hypothetical protein